MNEQLLTIFVGVTALAVVLQMVILAAMFFATRKTAAQVQVLSKRMEEEVLPTFEKTRALIEENGPKVSTIITDVSETVSILKVETQRISLAVDDIIDRARMQTLRADEMVTKTLDQIEHTTETVQQVVLTPMRRLSGIVTGLMVGFGEFVGGQKVKRAQGAVPRDEMFI